MREILGQIKRFIIVGLLSAVVNYGFFLICFDGFNLHYALASTLGYISGLVFGYFFNRSWTFSAGKRSVLHSYGATYLSSLLISIVFLRLLVDTGGIAPTIGNVLAIGLSTILNFIGCRYFVFRERSSEYFRSFASYCTRGFWIILGIKGISSLVFGSAVMVSGFIPFVAQFSTTFSNPYQSLAVSTGSALFPYPAGMLYVVSAPFLFFERLLPDVIASDVNIQLLLIRIAVLLADVAIFFVLCKLLPTKEKSVFWLYFTSPVLFYINYFHGQLDVIPTSLFFISLLLLLRNRTLPSFIIFGLGVATKTHLLIALPFYCVYLYRNRIRLRQIVQYSLISLGIFAALNLPFLSPEFMTAVFNNPEQQRLFSLFIPFGSSLAFFIAPAALLLVFYNFRSYRRLNADALMLALALSYTVLITLVPPMQGWFYWSFPFLLFFFIKYRSDIGFSLKAMSGFYLLYFLFSPTSDIFSALSPTITAAASLPNPYQYLESLGINSGLLHNLLFTGLEASLLVNLLWVYRVGARATAAYQQKKQCFIIGVGGDSGVGKSTLTEGVSHLFGEHALTVIDGDDLHKWERGDPRWEFVTHLNPKGNRVHTDLEHGLKLLRGESIERVAYDHHTGKFVEPKTLNPSRFIVFQGLMPFVLEQMRQLYDLKIYIEVEEELRVRWKLARDTSERAAKIDKVKKQIESRKPDAEKFIHPQRDFADWILRYERGEGLYEVVARYTIRNSIAVDAFVEELSKREEIFVDHSYGDLTYQHLAVRGKISGPELKTICFKLYPNVLDLTGNEPVFSDNLKGINQLFLLTILHGRQRFEPHEALF